MDVIKTTKVDNCRMINKADLRKPYIGTLHLMATKLLFKDAERKTETWIVLTHIATIDKGPLSTTGSPLTIRCKTFRSVTFVIPKERECHDIFLALQNLSRPVHYKDLYCFTYTSTKDVPKSYGWDFFNLEQEYKRMGVPNEEWNLTNMNKKYELCDTYPRYLYVPAGVTTSILIGSSKFRSKGRLPVLSYLHRNNKAVICRCSQPLSGFSARCFEDEQLLNCILKTNPTSSFMYVVDTRPKINAIANRAAGKGYENENFYENIKFQFFGIENIHVMRTSLAKLVETCEMSSPSVNTFLSGLDSAGWLKHIKLTLDTAWFITQAIVNGVSVVVHCSDGWDRTVQVCSLASLMLDPFYRTIKGYQVLIDKDWLSFGHKFSDRCGHRAVDPKEVSPVFLQFLECTWQLTCQFPQAFEFNERFFLYLHDNVTSCKYGTFVGNCEKDRLDLRLSEETYSLWGRIANKMGNFVNPIYSPDAHPDSLKPDLSPQNIRFWRDMYCRFDTGVHPQENLADIISATRDHTSSLDDHVKLLQKRILTFKRSFQDKCVSAKNGFRDFVDRDKCEEAFERQVSDENLSDPLPSTPTSMNSNSTVNGLTNSFRTLDVQQNGHLKAVENDEHPLSPNNQLSNANNGVTCGYECNNLQELLSEEINSIAIDWKSVRTVDECQCSAAFDHLKKKYHCFKCGDILCARCIGSRTKLAGHLNRTDSIVCKNCCNEPANSSSTESARS